MSLDGDRCSAAGAAFQELVALVDTLRGPGGCPWDAEQTSRSLRPNLLEETYEALEAIDSGAPADIEDELGDLMTQIIFHADISRRAGGFDAASLCGRVTEKLTRRHPHVFGDAERASDSEDVVQRWDEIKRAESGGRRSLVESLPSAMPALAYSASVQRRVMRAGLALKSDSRLPALELRGSGEEMEKQAGDILMALVRSMQAAGVDPEAALRAANARLRERVLRAEALAGELAIADLTDDRRSEVWQAAEQPPGTAGERSRLDSNPPCGPVDDLAHRGGR